MDVIETISSSLAKNYDRLPDSLKRSLKNTLSRVPIERMSEKIPFLGQFIESQYETVLRDLSKNTDLLPEELSFTSLPKEGIDKTKIITSLEKTQGKESHNWQGGFASGTVYHGGKEHISFLNKVYALHSQVNPLHSDIWPSASRYEREVVLMVTRMLHGRPGRVFGSVTSGGTESILLAMKAYRDYFYRYKGIKNPEIIAPETAHAAFDKGCEYFGIKKITIPVDASFKADLRAFKKAITRKTIMACGSAPSFPHGIIDPIEEMAELAKDKGIGFHTDACLGGFILPFIDGVKPFDFRVKGVTSISCDTHKYGYAGKGSSVVLYNDRKIRRQQFYATSDWPGGLYGSPTFAGSRPGALIVQAWAALVSIGEEGYREKANKIIETASWIKKELAQIPEVFVLGDPLWVVAFSSKTLNIYRIFDEMTKKGWHLNGLQSPPAIHLCLTHTHTHENVKERFISDLRGAVEVVRAEPSSEKGMAPIYGMSQTIPFKGLVSELIKRYLEMT